MNIRDVTTRVVKLLTMRAGAKGLYLLIALDMNVYLERVPSYLAAMTAGYILNRYFTIHYLETGRALRHAAIASMKACESSMSSSGTAP